MIRPRKVILGLLIVCVGYLYIVWSPESGGKDPEEDPTEEVYWFNEVTGISQWEEPVYEYKADDGTPYWLDPDTDKTSWDKPASLSWVEMQGEDGTLYYWNEVTKLSQWDKPVSIAWTQVVHIPGITDREQGSDAQNDTIEEEEEESEAEESVDQEDSIAIDRDL